MLGSRREEKKQVSVPNKKAPKVDSDRTTTVPEHQRSQFGPPPFPQKAVEPPSLISMSTVALPTTLSPSPHQGPSGRVHMHQNNNNKQSLKYGSYSSSSSSSTDNNNNNGNNNSGSNGKPFISHYHASYLSGGSSYANRGLGDGSAGHHQFKRRSNNVSGSWNNAGRKRISVQHHQQQNPSISQPNCSVPPPALPASLAKEKAALDHPAREEKTTPTRSHSSPPSFDGCTTADKNSVGKKPAAINGKPGKATSSPQGEKLQSPTAVNPDQEGCSGQDTPKATGQNTSKNNSPKTSDSAVTPPQANAATSPTNDVNARTGEEPDRVSAAGPTQYPHALLKVIRDNMNAKDNTNLWALLNNIAGPLIIKNVNSTLGLPPLGSPTGSNGHDARDKEAALLQTMEHNFIQNHPGYELLANAIFSNGGLLPNYFSDPLLSTFTPPPGLPVTSAVSSPTVGASDTFPGKGSSVVPGSPGATGNGAAQQTGQHQNSNFSRASAPEGVGGHHGPRPHGMYSPPFHHHQNPHHGNGMGYNPQYNQNAPFFFNGHMFYPRPKNFWNFCIQCKKSQYCPVHHNFNSSAAAFCMNGNNSNTWQHHYIAMPNNYYLPEYYHHYNHHHRQYHNSYYGHHHNNHGQGGGGHRDKRNHRRQYQNKQQYQGNKSPPGSTTAGSCPPSPKTASPPPATGAAGAAGGSVSTPPQNKRHEPRRNQGPNDRKMGSGSGGRFENGGPQNKNNNSGKKRWQQQRTMNGYDSDTSSSRSNGTDSNYALKCNYGLLQNMKLWHTETTYKKEQLLTGELGPQQLMSPTNHHPPILVAVAEAQCGDGRGDSAAGAQMTTTQPVIHIEEQDSESAYWSSIFPFSGGLEEGVQSVDCYTPADKYLGKAHQVEMLDTPKELIEGFSRDTLSQQIWNTFLTVQQTQGTYRQKLTIWKLLFASIKKIFPHLSVYLVGSTITGFGAETSDVDMCVVSSEEYELEPRLEAVMNLTDLKRFLSVSEAFEKFHLIQAKVPILRFRDTANQIEVDLNYNNSVGIRNTHLLYCYSKLDWRVRPLVLVVKLWAKFHDINNAKNMTISSYSLALMVIHFLQCGVAPCVLPCLHSMYPGKFIGLEDVNDIDMNEDLDSYESQNKQTLGELLLQFLYYYSTFDYNNLAISVRTGSCLYIEDCRYVRSPKNDPQQWKNLCIEEPFDYTNTARSVYDVEVFQKIKYVFVQSYEHLQQTLDLKSILNKKFISFPVSHGSHKDSQSNVGNEL